MKQDILDIVTNIENAIKFSQERRPMESKKANLVAIDFELTLQDIARDLKRAVNKED